MESDWGVFGWEWDSWERSGEALVEGGGLVGTTTLGGRGVLEVALEGPDERLDGEVRIFMGIPVKAGRKWRGGSWGAPETSECSEFEEVSLSDLFSDRLRNAG